MQYFEKNRISTESYIKGVLNGDTVILSKALSLVESSLDSDQAAALEILEGLHSKTGQSIRVGITGAPGAGKSTFIESLGLFLVNQGHKVAVLTVDPTSLRTKGSILGDKTRMAQLSKTKAFIRPSSTGTSLGGVAHHTRESILLCEAAGYEVVLIETVGVGQSEVLVRDMVDFFLLLILAGAGDELQGIKRGIIEMADALAITKADGENLARAKRDQAVYSSALHLLTSPNSSWSPPVLTCSSKNNEGIEDIWAIIQDYYRQMSKNGFLQSLRQDQQVKWMRDCIRLGIERHLNRKSDSVKMDQLKQQVREGSLLPIRAAVVILEELINKQ